MKNKCFFITICVIFLFFTVSYSTAYQIEKRIVTQDVDEMNYSEYNEYIKNQSSEKYNPVTEGYIIDAPWKIESGKNIFPLLTIADDSAQLYPDITNIYVCDYYDNPNCDTFIAFTNWDDPQVITSDNTPFFYTFYLNKNSFEEVGGNIAIKVKFDLSAWWLPDNWEGPIYINLSNSNTPKVDGWYCGDMHYHSKYTDTNYWPFYGEFGAPINTTINAGEVMGLDWLTVTDHSNSFGEHPSYWDSFKSECISNNRCLVGEEVNSDPEVLGNVPICESLPGNHVLAYDINSALVDNGCNGIPSPSQIINNINNQNGFTYAAHPESEDDVILGWDSIITNWQDYSLNFNGLEIWNGRLDEGNNAQELEAGLEKWKDILLGRNGLQPRKVFISAGSDAHGDFNTAFGKEYTCVYAPSYSKTNIFNGLKNGNSYMSNNGALIFSIGSAKLGETTTAPINSQVALSINYNLESGCYVRAYRGVIGGSSETQIGSAQWKTGSGSLTIYSNISANSYYRVDCKNSDGTKRIYTNPIWVNVTQQLGCVIPTNNMTLSQSTTFCYGQYFLPDGIKISSENVVLDCNGSRLFGNLSTIDNFPYKQGIWTRSAGITIKNCGVSNYFYGIDSFNNLISNKIYNNTLHNNKRAVSASSKHEISFNKIYNNSIVGLDVSVSGGAIANVSFNSIYNNSGGILFYSGSGTPSNVNWNEIYNNPSFSIALIGPNDLDATNNWWGTNNVTQINQSIIDFYDNGAGIVHFIPFIDCVPNLINTTWSNWTNVSCLINDKMNQSRFRIRYDANNCGTIANQTFYEYRANETCNYCSSNIVGPLNTTWSACNTSDNQTRISYYLDLNYSSCCFITNLSSDCGIRNQTYQNRTEIQGCNYCSPNPVNTTWTNWTNQTSCLNGTQIQNRSKTEYDANYSTCYAITHLPSDLFVNVTYWEFGNENCPTPPVQNLSLTLNSPKYGIYNTTRVIFNATLNSVLPKLEYFDSFDSRPRWITLCTNCQTYARTKTLDEGNHSIIFRGTLASGQSITNQTNFFIDSEEPRISTTKPRSRSFTNGSNFYVKYTEDNCQLLKILINDSLFSTNACESGRNIEKTLPQTLNQFDEQEIEYSFVILDIANNAKESRRTKVKVDTTYPVISSFNVSVGGRYAYFNMTINEINFDSVNYLDNSDSSQRWRILCSSLRNGVCYKKVSFRTGQHNLIVQAVDEAGNSIEREVSFNI